MKEKKSTIFRSLIYKEYVQIIRDPSSILIAFVLPLMLMFLFAYAINFDNNQIKVGLLFEGYRNQVNDLITTMENTSYIVVRQFEDRKSMERALTNSEIKAMVIVPNDFAKNISANIPAKIQLLIDGTDPNMSTFVEGYISGAVSKWLQIEGINKGNDISSNIDIQSYVWFNPDLKSRNLILPGSIANIMTLVGMMLTALVIVREWERGTMEALLTTKIKKMDIILSKFVAYYCLAMVSTILCSFLCIVIFKVPFHGSYIVYFITSSLFIFTSLGQGLLISTTSKSQFLASMTVSNVGFTPANMLSGMMFEISSMPKIVQFISLFVPARYFTTCIVNLFNAGNIWSVLLEQSAFLAIVSILLFILVYKKTKTRLE